MDRTITLTQEQVDALGYALDLAHSDQESYLANGSPEQDYGDDWPATAQFKAEQFRAIATLADSVGLHGELERWNNLALSVLGEEVTDAAV